MPTAGLRRKRANCWSGVGPECKRRSQGAGFVLNIWEGRQKIGRTSKARTGHSDLRIQGREWEGGGGFRGSRKKEYPKRWEKNKRRAEEPRGVYERGGTDWVQGGDVWEMGVVVARGFEPRGEGVFV